VRNFFVTGLPRSRTAWLANFLTHGPVSLCYHDILRVDPKLERLNALSGYQFVGDSDSALLLEWPRWVKQFPGARWVVINRPMVECLESFMHRFNAGRPYPGAPTKIVELTQVFHFCDRLKRIAERGLPAEQTLKVEFADLNKEETIRRVWDWCLPGVEFPRERWEMLHTFQVNVMPEKFGG
jgi:hypothetical protein